MLNIAKQRQPDFYTEWKLKENQVNNLETYTGKYDDLMPSDVKQGLREALCKEQGYLCCYCMNRIQPDKDNMRLEHWQSQHGFPARKFDYTNMLAACCGGEGSADKEFFCDKLKEDSALKFCPAADDVESKVKYSKDGKILSTDLDFDQQLNSVLNLNRDVIKNNRAAVLEGMIEILNRAGWTRRQFENRMEQLRTCDADGNLKPYSGVELYELKRRHARAAR